MATVKRNEKTIVYVYFKNKPVITRKWKLIRIYNTNQIRKLHTYITSSAETVFDNIFHYDCNIQKNKRIIPLRNAQNNIGNCVFKRTNEE